MQEQINFELLRFAVSTAMFCPQCGQILDVRRAVLVTLQTPNGEKTYVMCGKDWDEKKFAMRDLVTQAGDGWSIEVIDGRPVKKVRKPRKVAA